MPPLSLFNQGDASEPHPSLLILRIQPEEGISLRFQSKQPGSGMRLRPVSMDFNYGASFGERSPSAYETLLVDALVGEAFFEQVDVGQWDHIDRLITATVARYGRLDVMINNAAISSGTALLETTDAQWEQQRAARAKQ